MRSLVFCGVLFVAGMPASAQDMVFSPSETETCLAGLGEGQDAEACVGESARVCMEINEGGYSTVGIGACLNRELEYWDARLNAAYHQVRKSAKATDAEMKEIGSSVASQADALRDMQRAWITFRDAACDYERSLWGGGTGGGPATVACHMQHTARQTMYLEAQDSAN